MRQTSQNTQRPNGIYLKSAASVDFKKTKPHRSTSRFHDVNWSTNRCPQTTIIYDLKVANKLYAGFKLRVIWSSRGYGSKVIVLGLNNNWGYISYACLAPTRNKDVFLDCFGLEILKYGSLFHIQGRGVNYRATNSKPRKADS